jgi:hypothetical protein
MGNLVHRATNLCLKNCAGAVPACAPEVGLCRLNQVDP